jgi:hypothetical protein
LDDQHTVAGVLMEIVEKLVLPFIQGSDEHGRAAVRENDLFAIEIAALEFGGRRILVDHQNLELGVGRGLEFGWLEGMILDDQLVHGHVRTLRKTGTARRKDQSGRHQPPFHAASPGDWVS